MPDSQTIRVSNPDKNDEGKKVQVKVIKNYEEEVWDLDKLKFEVEKVIQNINLLDALTESPEEISRLIQPYEDRS